MMRGSVVRLAQSGGSMGKGPAVVMKLGNSRGLKALLLSERRQQLAHLWWAGMSDWLKVEVMIVVAVCGCS
jgi:hypothetical protein